MYTNRLITLVALIGAALILDTTTAAAEAVTPADAPKAKTPAVAPPPALPIGLDIQVKLPAPDRDPAARRTARKSRKGGKRSKARKPATTVELLRSRSTEMPPEPEHRAVARPLGDSAVQAVIKRNMAGVRHCYQRISARYPGVSGVATLKFTVTPDGKTTDISVKAASKTLRKIRRCVTGRIRTWQFPKADAPTQVAHPVSFTVAGRAGSAR